LEAGDCQHGRQYKDGFSAFAQWRMPGASLLLPTDKTVANCRYEQAATINGD